jgi:hypothetical protein
MERRSVARSPGRLCVRGRALSYHCALTCATVPPSPTRSHALAGTIGNAIHDGMRARLLMYRTQQQQLQHSVGRGSKGGKVGSDVHLDAGGTSPAPGSGGDLDAERTGLSVGHSSSLSSGGSSGSKAHHLHHHHGAS